MQNIGNIIDKLLRNHIYKIIIIHWISYQPFEQPGPDLCYGGRGHYTFSQINIMAPNDQEPRITFSPARSRSQDRPFS